MKPTKEQIFGRVKALLVAKDFDPDAITMQAHMERDLGGDYMDSTTLSVAIEEEFGIEVPDEDGDKWIAEPTIASLVDYIDGKIG